MAWVGSSFLLGGLLGDVIKTLTPKAEQSAVVYITPEEKLQKIVDAKLNELMTTNYFEHENTDGCNLDCRTQKEGWKGLWLGENLYYGTCDLTNAINLWNQSPAHKEILESEFNFGNLVIGQADEKGYCYMVLGLALK
jgi:uncharacterized protein YkwD